MVFISLIVFIQLYAVIVVQFSISFHELGETKLICWSTGPTDPILIKSKQIILQTFGQLFLFWSIIFCFSNKNKK